MPSGSRARVAYAAGFAAAAAVVYAAYAVCTYFIKIDHEDGMSIHLSTGQPAFSHQEQL
jgi:hypothetical protein